MKRKNIIRIIREKADQRVLPDLAESIIKKTLETPIKRAAHTPVTSPFRRRMALASFSFVLIVLLSVFVFMDTTPEYTFEAQDDIILLSAIYADGLLTDDLEAMTAGDVSLDSEVIYAGIEVPKIAGYMVMVNRQLMLDFLPSFARTTDAGVTEMMFTTLAGSSLEKTYTLRYGKDIIDARRDEFILTGTLSTGTDTVQFQAESFMSDGRHGLIFTLGSQDEDGVVVTYEENGDETPYDAKVFNRGQLRRRIELSSLTGSTSMFTMHFTEGDVIGSYRFERHTGLPDHHIDVTYAILTDSSTETGTMDVTLAGSSGQESIRFVINARGKEARTFTFGSNEDQTSNGNI